MQPEESKVGILLKIILRALCKHQRKKEKTNTLFPVLAFTLEMFYHAKCPQWGRRKRVWMIQNKLKWLGKENKQKKAWQNNCAWIVFPRVSMSLTNRQYRTHQKSLWSLWSFFLYKTFFCLDFLFFRLLSSIIFCPLNMIAIALFVRPTFASSLMGDVLLFVPFCFYFFELVHIFLWSMFTYN